MRMRLSSISIPVLSCAVVLSVAVVPAAADSVYLKNGRSIEGLITGETADYVELSVGIGTVKFYRDSIERVERSSKRENRQLQEGWAQHLQRQKEEALRRQQEAERSTSGIVEAERRGDHLFVEATFNGTVRALLMVDTGASNVILSTRKARELGFDLRGDVPEAVMKIADGREVAVKLFTVETMNLTQVQASKVAVAVPMDEAVLSGMDGLLGMSFLRLFAFEIDLKKNRLIFRSAED